jgi:aryl-alcohol dehydrogenase-like predicted oxidoreductase
MENGATLDGIRQQLLESLQRLDCGYVDLYYMHRVCSKVAIEDVAHSLKQLQVNRLLCHRLAAAFDAMPLAERRPHQARGSE